MTATIQFDEQTRTEAVASLQEYFRENMPDELGTLPAGLLLDFFLEEIAPVVYNRAVADVQERLQARIAEVDGELYADPFQYWPRLAQKRKKR